MPLVRVEVRNEYRLGMPELYKEANREDPKALLDGVAVAGLVGILRQLGDLADFAAEVFHGLQEQAMNAGSRSHKLMVRVQTIEAALPPLEKTILSQRSHLHFAYTTGSNWHARLQSEHNHFIYGDLPSCIMDSYEECHGPPRLHLLDKFDTGGPGSCLKRFSDPTFFRRASAGFGEAYAERVRRFKKARRRKKKKTWLKNGEVPHGESHGMPVSSHSGRMQYASRNCDEQTSPSQTVSTFDAPLKSELGEKSHSFDSKAGSGYIECIFSPSYTMKSDGHEPEEISSQFKLHSDTLNTSSLDKQRVVVDDDSQELIGSKSSCVTWDEKTEIREPIGPHIDSDETAVMILTNFVLDPPEGETVKLRTDYQMDFIFDNASMQASVSGGNQFDDIETATDNYMDALNTIDTESETDLQCQTKREVEQFSTLNNKTEDRGIQRLTSQHSDSHSLVFEPHVPDSEIHLECQTKREAEQFSALNNIAVDEGMHRLTPQHSNSHLLNFEPHVPVHIPSNIAICKENYSSVSPESPKEVNSLLNKEASIAKPNSIPSECQSHVQSPQKVTESLTLNTFPDIDSSGSEDILDGSNTENVVRSLSSSKSSDSNSHLLNFEPNVPVHIPSNIAICKENYSSVSPESPKEVNSLLNKEASIAKPNSIPSECQSHVQSPQKVTESLTLNTFPDIDSSGSEDILDGSNTENVVRSLSSSKSREPSLQNPKSDSIVKSSCESQNSPSLLSSVTGINFWTNGGLLGLEPSKPPDFSVLNSVNHNSVAKSKEETIFCSNQSNSLEGDGHAVKTNTVKNSKMAKPDISSKCSTSCHNDQEDSISMMSTSWRSSQVQLDVKLEDSTEFHRSINSNQSFKLGFCETSSKMPGTEEPVNPDAQATKSCKYDGKNSSRMFEFSNRLLVNGFQRRVYHVGDDNFVSSVKNGVSEQKSMSQEYQAFSGRTFKEQFGSRSSCMSPSSSPPLENMKISFRPIDIFETSKLKLKFPDASECRESGGDMFPSFQLVPEQSISLQDLGSDSDDDTFSRSSPNRSDDCLGHYSESGSGQWEAGESPRCKDYEIYNALCRISTTDSVSSDLEIGRKAQGVVVDNCELQNPFTEHFMEPSQCPVLDLPSFDTLNPSFGQELHNDFDARYCQKLDFSKEPTPASPPLPLVEWRAMKPNPDVAIEKQDTPFEALKHAVDLKLSPSTTSQQPKPTPVKHDQNTEALICTATNKQPDGQKLNGQKDAKQPSNGKEMDEKEDFLQQIKTKSFGLQRTVTDRLAFTPGAPANVKVTAILEKANAIRQAVGGNDDSWSDA